MRIGKIKLFYKSQSLITKFLMPSLHHRHGKDKKTALSIIVGGMNKIGDRSRQSSLRVCIIKTVPWFSFCWLTLHVFTPVCMYSLFKFNEGHGVIINLSSVLLCKKIIVLDS